VTSTIVLAGSGLWVGDAGPEVEGVTVGIGVDGVGEPPPSGAAFGRSKTKSTTKPAPVAAMIDQRAPGFT
jgi:hypothetical protein